MSGAPGFQVVHVCETATVGAHDRVIVWLWHVAPNDAALASVKRLVGTLARKYPEGVGVLHLLPNPDGKIPSDDQRKKIAQLRRDCDYAVRASAIVFEGDGIRSAIIRSIATAVMLASGSKRPLTVFGDAKTAASWLRERLAVPLDEPALIGASVAIRLATTPSAGVPVSG